MSVNVTSSVPRTEYRGISAEQQSVLALPVENLPIHLPLYFIQAGWGELSKANYVDESALSLLYGDSVLKPLDKYFNHQHQFLRSHLTAAGRALVLRVANVGAEAATNRVSVDVVDDEIPVYERNSDGSYKRDNAGKLIATGQKIQGTRIQLRVGEIPKGSDNLTTFGKAVKSQGNMTSVKTGAVSELIPALDTVARCVGSAGRLRGFRLWAPNGNADGLVNSELNEKLGSFVYRFQFIERSTEASTPRAKRTLSGEDGVSFSFKKGAVDLDNKVQYTASKVLKSSYESNDPTAFTQYGPFDKMFTYDNNILELLTKLAEAEAEYTGDEIADPHLINFLTGVDVEGIPYHTFVVEGIQQGGAAFTSLTNHYYKGGSDGTVSSEAYNTVVSELLDGLVDSNVPFRSIARMPYSAVYDTGFPVATKLKFGNFLSLRPDVMVHVCTQDVLGQLNTPSQDSSIGITLRSHFRAIQESSEFGTRTVRVMVMANAGYLINDDYDGLVPFLEFLGVKMAMFAGAEGGSFTAENAFGRGEQNVITRYYGHNVTEKLVEVKNVDWANGLNYAEGYDMTRMFWPGLQSIHENQTSILHGYLIAYIACNLTRIGNITWRELSGDNELSDPEFLAEVVKRVNKRATSDKYNGMVDITPNAYMTALDERLGHSWHLDIGMAGDNIRTVEHLAIISQPRRTTEEAA